MYLVETVRLMSEAVLDIGMPGKMDPKFVNPNEEHIENCTYMFLTHFDHGYLIWPLKLSDLRCCSLLTLRMLGLDEVSQM